MMTIESLTKRLQDKAGGSFHLTDEESKTIAGCSLERDWRYYDKAWDFESWHKVVVVNRKKMKAFVSRYNRLLPYFRIIDLERKNTKIQQQLDAIRGIINK